MNGGAQTHTGDGAPPDGRTATLNGREIPANWESSLFWQEQLRLAALSRENSAPHNYARVAARASKGGPPGTLASQTNPLQGQSTTVADLAIELVKDVEARKQGAQTNGAGTPLRAPARSQNPREKKEMLDMEKQRHINEDINKQFWTAVDLSGQGLLNVSPRLFQYEFLQKLFLNNNRLQKIPLAVVKMPQLRVLDLSQNAITEIPAALGKMIGLRYLFLFDNNISTLPSELGGLFQLEVLGIEGNPLSDDIRTSLANEGTKGLIMAIRDSAPAGQEPRPRQWLEIEQPSKDSKSGKDTGTDGASAANGSDKAPGFSLLSYNILCDRYASPTLYGYTPSWALSWSYRSERLIEEISAQDSDIICLQEVNLVAYEESFLPHFDKTYKSLFYPKTRARTMTSHEESRLVDGCVTFYRADKFKLIKYYSVEYNSKALQKDDLKKSVDIFNRVMTRDNVALIAVFEHLETGRPFIMANTHLHWDPAYKDVKLVQSAILLEEVENIAKIYASNTTPEGQIYPQITDIRDLPVTVCGDFNATKDSGVYQLFSTSSVPPNHPDFESYSYGNFTEAGMSHKMTLKSAYADGMDLPFTNYTPEFTESIDYIWYSSHTLRIKSLYGPVDQEYADRYLGFPNPHHPSDHVPVAAELTFTSKGS